MKSYPLKLELSVSISNRFVFMICYLRVLGLGLISSMIFFISFRPFSLPSKLPQVMRVIISYTCFYSMTAGLKTDLRDR